MRLLILISSYNGSNYIREQLASILSQDFDGEIVVLIRDDGSHDETVQIIKEINDSRVEVVCGKNLGAKGSFLALLAEARRRSPDFVALADQDDVWLPGKLQRAVDMLRSVTGPALYCSALNLVDDKLQPIGTYIFADTPGFEAAFLTNCATGCTCVFNREFLDLLDVLPDPDEILMHDWWLYIVAAAFGRVIYDDVSMILYRQHAANQVGMRLGFTSIFYRVRRLLRRPARPSRLTQAREFARIYGVRLSPRQSRYLSELIRCDDNFMARIKFAFIRRPKCRNLIDDIAVLGAFLLGR
jgi:glycosyltransferase involved in cell wall biosynthesis